jgi:hypothetical protein
MNTIETNKKNYTKFDISFFVLVATLFTAVVVGFIAR